MKLFHSYGIFRNTGEEMHNLMRLCSAFEQGDREFYRATPIVTWASASIISFQTPIYCIVRDAKGTEADRKAWSGKRNIMYIRYTIFFSFHPLSWWFGYIYIYNFPLFFSVTSCICSFYQFDDNIKLFMWFNFGSTWIWYRFICLKSISPDLVYSTHNYDYFFFCSMYIQKT